MTCSPREQNRQKMVKDWNSLLVMALVVFGIKGVNCVTTNVVLLPSSAGRCNYFNTVMDVKALSLRSNLPADYSCRFQVRTSSTRAEGFIITPIDLPHVHEQLFIYDLKYQRNISINEQGNVVCHLMGPVLTIYYGNFNSLLVAKVNLVFSQYICQASSLCYMGCKTTECLISGEQAPCHKACISSDMRCDGFINCPFQEDEVSCVISTLSRIAFIGTVVLFILFMIAGLGFIAFRKFRRWRYARDGVGYVGARRGGAEGIVVSMDVISENAPPSYNELDQNLPNSSYYTMQKQEELPKYNQIETVNLPPIASEPPPTAPQEQQPNSTTTTQSNTEIRLVRETSEL